MTVAKESESVQFSASAATSVMQEIMAIFMAKIKQPSNSRRVMYDLNLSEAGTGLRALRNV